MFLKEISPAVPLRRASAIRLVGKDATLLNVAATTVAGCAARVGFARRVGWLALVVCAVSATTALAVEPDIALPEISRYEPIVFSSQRAWRWQQGGYEVWILRGACRLEHGARSVAGEEAVLWIRRGGDLLRQHNQVIAYFAGGVRVADARDSGRFQLADAQWLGEFTSLSPVEPRTPPPLPEPAAKPPVFVQALAARDGRNVVTQAQFAENIAPAPAAEVVPVHGGNRRLRGFPRSSVKVQAQTFPGPSGNEWITVISSGINLIIDGLDDVGAIDIATDRMVIWSAGLEPDLSGQSTQGRQNPLEIYMEGNIVFRQGDRVIHAQRMYYDVTRNVGTVLQAELLTPVQDYQGLVRLKADVVRQLGRDRFVAERAYLTSSRMGEPGYRLQANQIEFQDSLQPRFDPFSGAPQVDPETGEQIIDHQRLATSRNNFLYLGQTPVFYWPQLSTNLEDPTFYIRRASVRNDSIFGTQLLTDWDAYQLLGIRNAPEDTDWTISLDYLSERGFGYGTEFRYLGDNLFDRLPGPYHGFLDAWAIHDSGNDNLGGDRSNVPPEADYRYRVLGQHRHRLPNNFQFTGELGLISDRNFLEQYYELEWDTFKDQTTGFELKQTIDGMSWSLSADTRVNDFFTQTEWLPRLDHYWLGQSLAGDWLTWYEHSSVGYGKLRIFSTPEDPVDAAVSQPLPWEITSSGERLVTRQELDLPLDTGLVKIVPYALGELAHWGEDLSGDDLQRAFYQVGVRASLPLWAVNPGVQNGLFNLNGLAHKAIFQVDASFAEATRDVTDLPLYDPLDDDAQEHFRRRMRFNTFGGVTPPQFDERFYAIRSGLGSWVTSPAAEVVDDMTSVRMGLNQRWQTKRGAPGRERIIDWVTLNTEAVYFPKPERDNFGEDFGLLGYDFRWHLGDRTTLLSDGSLDFFDQGQQTVSVGAMLSRPPRGQIYIGYRSLQGPFNSEVVIGQYSYQLSPKWVSSTGVSYDFNNSGSLGNNVSLTRVGESFLTSFTFVYDGYKDNVGVSLMVQPRMLSRMARGVLGAVEVPPAGAFGLE